MIIITLPTQISFYICAMFRVMIPILLAIVVLLQSMPTWLMYVAHQVNKDKVINELCVNKAKPALKCNGKCHLNKKIKQEIDKQQQNDAQKESSVVVEWSPIIYLPVTPTAIIHVVSYKVAFKTTALPKYIASRGFDYHGNIFHPPVA